MVNYGSCAFAAWFFAAECAFLLGQNLVQEEEAGKRKLVGICVAVLGVLVLAGFCLVFCDQFSTRPTGEACFYASAWCGFGVFMCAVVAFAGGICARTDGRY